MNKLQIMLAGFAVALTAGCAGEGVAPADDHTAAGPAEVQAIHWGYGPDDGPASWGGMNAEWTACSSGEAQSPIDIRDVTSAAAIPGLALAFPETSIRIVRQEYVLKVLDNGHTIQVNVDAADTLTIGEERFGLRQYHFHSPSEHTVDGEHYAMEMHLVHESADGDLAVVGVLIEEGEHNAAFDAVWRNRPTEPGTEVQLDDVSVNIDDLLPTERTHWRYHGSLTTPPCSEGVRWFLMKTPIRLDAEQIRQFRDEFTGNTRPTQEIHGREIIEAGSAS